MSSVRYLAQQPRDFLTEHHSTLLTEIKQSEATVKHGSDAMTVLYDQYVTLADVMLQSKQFTADEKRKIILPNLHKITADLTLDSQLAKRARQAANYFNCGNETRYQLASDNYLPAICDLFEKKAKTYSLSIFETSVSDEGCYWAAKLQLLSIPLERLHADTQPRLQEQVKKAAMLLANCYLGVGAWYNRLVKEFRAQRLLSVNDPDAFILQAAAGKLAQAKFAKANQEQYDSIIKTVKSVLSHGNTEDIAAVINQKLNTQLRLSELRPIVKGVAVEEKFSTADGSSRPIFTAHSVYAAEEVIVRGVKLDLLFADDEQDIPPPPPVVREEPIEIIDYDPVRLGLHR
jgi:hypothetical protein